MIFFVFLLNIWFFVNFKTNHNINVDKKNKKPLKITLSSKIAIFYPLYPQLKLIKVIKSIFFLHLIPIIHRN